MYYDVILDVQGSAASDLIDRSFSMLSRRMTTPSFLAKKLPDEKLRYCHSGTLPAYDLLPLMEALTSIGASFDTLRMGKEVAR